jgi:hypothetical protein
MMTVWNRRRTSAAVIWAIVINTLFAFHAWDAIHPTRRLRTLGPETLALEAITFAIVLTLARSLRRRPMTGRRSSVWAVGGVFIGMLLAQAIPSNRWGMGVEALMYGSGIALIAWSPKYDAPPSSRMG